MLTGMLRLDIDRSDRMLILETTEGGGSRGALF